MTLAKSGYAPVNGLNMYYEMRGAGPPLILLHGAFMVIEGFGALPSSLATSRQVIAIEQQAHGRTADIDRALSNAQMADDTAALLHHIGIDRADLFGYSMGGGIALQLAIRRPQLVRKLVLAGAGFCSDGYHPGILDAIQGITPELFEGSPWLETYRRVAPDPAGFPALVDKIKAAQDSARNWSPEEIQAIAAPTLIIIGDADGIRPEHAVEMLRLRGGGVAGDFVGLPPAQLAVLPGTTHVALIERTDWLTSMVSAFLDAPMPEPA